MALISSPLPLIHQIAGLDGQSAGRPLGWASSAKRLIAGMSGHVQVFGRRHDEPFRALWRPASKKRQGTKSREVWHWRCCGRYGDLIAAPGWRVDVTPTGCGRRISHWRDWKRIIGILASA